MTFPTRLIARAAALAGTFSLAIAPVASQPSTPTSNQTHVDRNLDSNLLLYAALPALIAIVLAIAASKGGDSKPASP